MRKQTIQRAWDTLSPFLQQKVRDNTGILVWAPPDPKTGLFRVRFEKMHGCIIGFYEGKAKQVE